MKQIAIGIALLGLLMAGCFRGGPSEKPPIHVNPNMDQQPRYDAQAQSDFFADGATMRVPPAGTVARGFLRDDSVMFTGRMPDSTLIPEMPAPKTLNVLRRGQERYNIYCSPCHSRVGNGQGIMIQRGYLPPPSFFEERLLLAPDGHYFDVITNGIRNMPAYKYQIPVQDRWAIVAYVRALQRSQTATLQDVPEAMRGTIR